MQWLDTENQSKGAGNCQEATVHKQLLRRKLLVLRRNHLELELKKTVSTSVKSARPSQAADILHYLPLAFPNSPLRGLGFFNSSYKQTATKHSGHTFIMLLLFGTKKKRKKVLESVTHPRHNTQLHSAKKN